MVILVKFAKFTQKRNIVKLSRVKEETDSYQLVSLHPPKIFTKSATLWNKGFDWPAYTEFRSTQVAARLVRLVLRQKAKQTTVWTP